MAHELIDNLTKVYNGGRVQPTGVSIFILSSYAALMPTTFVFPPRNAGSRGPMVWNERILAFAGVRGSNQS